MCQPTDVLQLDERGLFCPPGRFHIDPVAPAELAVITHGHADHCRPGSGLYVVSELGAGIVQKRLGPDVALRILGYGERCAVGDVTISLHPAGHVLGSAQVLVEGGGERWLVTGDVKLAPDPTCAPLESVQADVLITEATFALPIYRWPDPGAVIRELLRIHAAAKGEGRSVVVFAYALGKAQRILALLAEEAPEETVLVHGAIAAMNDVYRDAGVLLPRTELVVETEGKRLKGALVLAPLSARGTPFMRRFSDPVQVLCSGHMVVRGERRRRVLDHGLVLSDHADFAGLLELVSRSGAQRVFCTHGHATTLARYLREERGLDAAPLEIHGWAGEAGTDELPEPRPEEPVQQAPRP